MSGEHSVHVHYDASDEHAQVDNPHFLVADHGSSVFLGACTNSSAWNGIGFLDLSTYHLHKTVHALVPPDPVSDLRVEPGRVQRSGEHLREEFFMHDRLACYQATGRGDVLVEVDNRLLDDFSTHGREHEATVLSTDPAVLRIDGKAGAFLIVSTAPVTLRDEWVEHDTPFDHARGGQESWWVQRRAAIHVSGDARVVICPERRRHEAVHVLRAGHVWQRHERTSGDAALLHAQESLDGLVTRTPNGEASILAGLPWFFQIYTRDEAIATGGLIAQGKYHLAGRILLREITTVLRDGHIPNRFPHSNVGSADGVGWAFLRLRNLFWRSRDSLREEQWSFVHSQLSTSLSRLRDHRMRDGFVHNNAQETWMDTTGSTSDARAGARVEIQALTLNMVRFAAELSEFLGHDPSHYRSWEQGMRSQVRDAFFDEQRCVLADGAGDFTIRPNIFIAHYAYDELLRNEQWVRVFERALDALLTDWGGVTSIDQDDALFLDEHSGEDDESYHRGDVWFFLNNLAAVCLLRTDDRFRDVAQRIFDASREDLLWRGACGHASEISGAARPEPFGCWCQAWSASTFIELSAALRK